MSYYIISSAKSIQNTVPSMNGDISTQNSYGATIVGFLAGLKNSGAFNVFVGMSSGANNNSGACNNFIGTYAGFNNVSGDGNTFLGTNAGYGNQTGIDNIFIGLRAGARNVSGVRNLAIGNNASQYINGNNNVYLGFNNTNTASDTLSSNNTSVGTYSVATGYQNITLGYSNSATRNADNSIVIGNYSTDVSCNNIILGNNIRNSGANVFILMNNASNNPPYSNNTSNLMNFNNAMIFNGDSNGNFNNGTMTTSVANILTKAYNLWKLQSSNGNSYISLTDSNIIISNLSNNMTFDSNGLLFQANNITFSNSSNSLHFSDNDFTIKSVAASVSTIGSNVLISGSNLVQMVGEKQVSLISSNSSIIVTPSNINVSASNLLLQQASNLNWSSTSGGQMALSNNNFNVSTNTGAISLNSNGVSLSSPNNVQISSQYLVSLTASNSSIAITPSNINVIAYCNLVLTGSNDVQITGPNQIALDSSCNILLNGSNSVQLASSNLVALQSSNSSVLVTPSNVKITGFPDVQIVGPNQISLNTSNSGIVLGPTNISINAASNVALNGSNQVSLNSSNIGLSASFNISLNTSNTINLASSNASIVIDPSNVTISGASNVALNGSNVTVTGSSNVSINSSNQVSLNGSNGYININSNGISLGSPGHILDLSSFSNIVLPTGFNFSSGNINASNIILNSGSNILLTGCNEVYITANNYVSLYAYDSGITISPCNILITASNLLLQEAYDFEWMALSGGHMSLSSNNYLVSTSYGFMDINSNGITLAAPGKTLDLSGFSNIIFPYNTSNGNGNGSAHIYVTCSNFATINDVYQDYEVTTLYGSTIIENNLYVGSNLICEKFQASITNINSCESLTLSTCNDLIFDGSNVIINGALQINGGFQVNGPNIVIGCGGVSKEEIYANDPVVSEYPNGSVIIDSNLWVGGTIYAGSYCCRTIKALSFDLTADQAITFASPSNAIFNTPGISLSGSNPYIHASNDLVLQASNVIIPNVLTMLNPSNSNCYWKQYIDSPFVPNANGSNMANNLVFKSCGGTVITFEDDFCPETLNFTGKHRCSPSDKSTFLKNKLTRSNKQNHDQLQDKDLLEDLQGLIVIADGTYLDLQDKNEIHIDEAIPRIQLTRRKADPRAFGVIGNIDNEGKYKIGNMFFMNTPKIQRFVVQSVGEGGIWVCNLGGNLKNGDYIMSSDLHGYGMRQFDNIHKNYTVAKITCDCNFKSNVQTIFKTRMVSFQGRKIKCCLVGCTYKF